MASIYSVEAMQKMARECVHGIALGVPCARCATLYRGERIRREMERKLRHTRLGRLCNIK